MRPGLQAFALASCMWLAGCEALGGILGAGVGSAVKKEQDSAVAETLTQPLARTKSAVLAALKRMQIEVTSSETDKATRVTVTVGDGLRKDRATAQELIDQTRRALGDK